MAKVSLRTRNTKKAAHRQNTKFYQLASWKINPFIGGFFGAAIGLPVSAIVLTAMLGSNVTPATAKLVQIQPAAASLSCIAPTSAALGAKVTLGAKHHKGANAPVQTAASQPAPTFITQLVGGTFAKNSVTSENNAPNGKAIAVTTNVVTDTNVSTDTNTTYQDANSGKVVVAGNTGATGSAQSGGVANTNSSSFETDQVN